MSEPKHTPAPWSLPHFARPAVGCRCGYVLADGYMGAVATVHCSGEGDGSDWRQGDNPKFDEAVANAHLIATAPALLAALIKATTKLEHAMIHLGSDPEFAAAGVEEFREVIARANGGNQP
ncbi:hypothetical protein C8D77_111159 [Mesorhizobium loti]|uniref:Uncharacterized protein n=1 Tax=Rhizobium loti TaxID=381 RepID=A0A8E3B315_RHILI|nr:hypothetical protein [Mesorhizobium loti]PWJ88436.1 hypothetical protein C8D77_111159 [Mesorhizobium loti]